MSDLNTKKSYTLKEKTIFYFLTSIFVVVIFSYASEMNRIERLRNAFVAGNEVVCFSDDNIVHLSNEDSYLTSDWDIIIKKPNTIFDIEDCHYKVKP